MLKMEKINFEYKKVNRDIRLKSAKTIEEIRKMVANNDRSIKVTRDIKVWYAALYRNGIKVAVVEVQNGMTEHQIREGIRSEVLLGSFDPELLGTHDELYRRKLEKRKAKALARNS